MKTNLRLKAFVFAIFCTSFIFSGLGQEVSWDEYQNLRAMGKVPSIFKMNTQTKIEQDLHIDRTDLSPEEEEQFLENIHYQIDDILRSGLVLYGDPATLYIQKVADHLLESNKKLKKELQFFAVKSNMTNAFSTDQGIIFVTLGLLAQLENEAQLAFVLAHEIAHYQEKHVEKSYSDYQRNNDAINYDEHIRILSQYSKEKELEADILGVKLYQLAGYKKSELLSAFDVLMYSYLPFDEVPFPQDYLNSEHLQIPTHYFPEKVNPILAEEEYNDEKSSHPNIRKRKEAILAEIKSSNDWGSKEFAIDENEFAKVRKMARFESVHRDLIDCNYPDALYSIFLLEQEHPDSKYLSRSKAKAWLGISSLLGNKGKSDVLYKERDIEGESHALVYLLNSLSRIQLLTIAMRQVEDVYQKYPEDEEIAKIRTMMIEEIAENSMFKIKNYRKITYATAIERFEKSKQQQLLKDSLQIVSDTLIVDEETEELSKYDKIKKKRTAQIETPTNEEEEFDVDQFHFFALSDLISDTSFLNTLARFEAREQEKKTQESAERNMSPMEKLKLNKERYHLGISEFVLMRPFVYQEYYGKIDMKGSVEFEQLVRESILKNAEKVKLSVVDFTNNEAGALTTEEYNRHALFTDYISQKMEYEHLPMLPVNYMELKEVMKDYQNTHIVFVLGNYSRTKVTHKFKLVFLVVDLATGEVVRDKVYSLGKKPRKVLLNSYTYEFIESLRKK